MTAPAAGRVLVETVARCLGPLREEVAFLGGAATSLLLSDPAAPEIRSTIDVDVIVEVASRIEYYRLAERLRELGFREVSEEGAPVCRWRVAGVLVDVMPTLPEVLGFSNRWYSAALATASAYRMAEDLVIRLVTPPYFLATKIEAFRRLFRKLSGCLPGSPGTLDEARTRVREALGQGGMDRRQGYWFGPTSAIMDLDRAPSNAA